MEPLPDTTVRRFNVGRFIFLSILIMFAGMVVVFTCLALDWWPGNNPTSQKLLSGAWFVFDPLLALSDLTCDQLNVHIPQSLWFPLLFSYGPFWALVIELVIKFRPRKRRAS